MPYLYESVKMDIFNCTVNFSLITFVSKSTLIKLYIGAISNGIIFLTKAMKEYR